MKLEQSTDGASEFVNELQNWKCFFGNPIMRIL